MQLSHLQFPKEPLLKHSLPQEEKERGREENQKGRQESERKGLWGRIKRVKHKGE